MIKKLPAISVIMSVYNSEKYLSKAIESILSQTFKNFEFIITDDGSSDDSLKIIEKFAQQDDRVKVISQRNIGLTKSLNKMIKISRGRYIARQDSDDISLPTRFEQQIKFLDSHNNYGLVGTNIIKIDEHDNELEINKTKYRHEDIVKVFKIRNCIAHGSVMINRELVGHLLQYDEQFLYAQDFKLWVEIAKKYKIANLRESLYKLRFHSKSISAQRVEQQSIYAGIVAYEFESKEKISKVGKSILSNIKLRKKIGKILLMNFQPKLARKYFKIYELFFYISFCLQFFNYKKIKSLFK